MILLPTWVVLVGGAVLMLVILAAVLALTGKPKDEIEPGQRRSWWQRLLGAKDD